VGQPQLSPRAPLTCVRGVGLLNKATVLGNNAPTSMTVSTPSRFNAGVFDVVVASPTACDTVTNGFIHLQSDGTLPPDSDTAPGPAPAPRMADRLPARPAAPPRPRRHPVALPGEQHIPRVQTAVSLRLPRLMTC
jgi:hypothetical protein